MSEKKLQQITFDAVRPTVEAVAATKDSPVVSGKPVKPLTITATAMPTQIERKKDRDGWYHVEIDGTAYRILPPTGADVEATLKTVVADILAGKFLGNEKLPENIEMESAKPEVSKWA